MNTTLQKIYRYLFHRGGHGVHSPFVFDLITKVIEEQRMYYCYEPLRKIRFQLLQEDSKIKKGLSWKSAFRRNCFSVNECELLFRLANHFKPEMIGVVGSGLGLAPLYLTAYSTSTHCIVFEPEAEIAAIARRIIRKFAHASVHLVEKEAGLFDKPSGGKYDFIVWGKGQAFSSNEFEEILPFITEKCVLVLFGINDSSHAAKTWRTICAHPKVTVTLDLCSIGIICFHPNLNRQTYKCFF